MAASIKNNNFEQPKNLTLLFIVNAPEFFLSHRLPLALAARDAGFNVHIATAAGPSSFQITGLGFTHHPIPISRSGRNIFSELRCLFAIYQLIHKIKPALVHLVTIKPVLYGGIIARIKKTPAMVAAISGMGTIFINNPKKYSLIRLSVERLYRVALNHPNSKVIFQNPDDQLALTNIDAVREDQVVMIKGSGVSLENYIASDEPEGVPVVTFAARLLKDKGIFEFVEAARILQSRQIPAHFWLVGSPDPGNLTSIDEGILAQWRTENVVKIFGHRSDIADLFSKSNIVVLPSYREGLPKTLIEAAACGRAVITTDVPGCRDAIEPGKTGLLVPVKNASALADAIQSLIEHPALRKQLGKAGRSLAVRDFSIEKVVRAHLNIYEGLLSNINHQTSSSSAPNLD